MSTEEIKKYHKLQEQNNEMYEALKEISKAKGTYSLDGYEHARNTIRDMQEIAVSLLKQIDDETN